MKMRVKFLAPEDMAMWRLVRPFSWWQRISFMLWYHAVFIVCVVIFFLAPHRWWFLGGYLVGLADASWTAGVLRGVRHSALREVARLRGHSTRR